MEVAVVHIGKGENVFQPHVAARLVTAAPTALVLLDMGSRGGGGPLLPQLPLAAAAAPAPEQRRKDGEGMEERQLPIDDSVGGGAVAKAVAPAAASAAAECAGGKGGGEGGGGDDGGGGGGFAVPTLVIDHHKPEGFPEGAVVRSCRKGIWHDRGSWSRGQLVILSQQVGVQLAWHGVSSVSRHCIPFQCSCWPVLALPVCVLCVYAPSTPFPCRR